MKRIKNLWDYSGKYKFAIALLPFVILIGVVLEILIPYLMSDMMDIGINRQDFHVIIQKGGAMILASLVMVFFGMLESYLIATWSSGTSKNLRDAMFEKVQELPFKDMDQYGTATILTRMSTDMNYIKMALSIYQSMIRCPIMIVCTIVMTVRVYANVSWIFIIAAVLFVFILIFVVRGSLKHYRVMFHCYDELTNVLEENITAERTVKAYAREEYENKKFVYRAEALKKEKLTAERITMLNDPLLHLVINICILLIVYIGGQSIIAGNMQAGDLFCVITYTNQLLLQIYIIALIIVPVLSAQISLNRVFEIINKKPSFDDENSNRLELENGSVAFRQVSFSYYNEKTKQVLKDIDVTIEQGSFFGITGSSGAGKSSLIKLIPRFYECMEGSVEVGGHKVQEYKLQNLRQEIGIVPQKSLLFSGTIRENLLWGNENATAEEIVKACCVADANQFIMGFPEGYDTQVGQAGQNLSGGQRQRLCIARALLRKPKILIFDDSLSAVDNTTEERIIKGLMEEYKDITILMISQRLSSIQKADQILVLDHGKMDAVGTHEELLQTSRIYREIYESQRRSLGE